MRHLFLIFALLSVSWAAPSSSNSEIGIVGGDDADIKDFPYMAALLYLSHQSCGGSLISNDTIVTAAHCVYFYSNSSDLSIRFGSSQWRTGGQLITAKQIIVHENYDPMSTETDYDVAVVKLNESVNVENAVPIPLAAAGSQFADGTLGVVSGWGLTSERGTGSETLRKVEVPVVQETKCRTVYGSIITNRTICAGYDEGGKDSCQQDSGGPYVINGALVGIVSFGSGCARPGYPGVYASVPTFNEWIKRNAGI